MAKDRRRCRAAIIGGLIAGAIAGIASWSTFGWKWGLALGATGALGGALLSWGTTDACGNEPPWPRGGLPQRASTRPSQFIVIVVWVLVAAGPILKDVSAVTPWINDGPVLGMLAGGRFYWLLGVLLQYGVGLYLGINRPSSQGVPAPA